MINTDTDALTEVVRELIRDKGNRVDEWPDDEAAAYRDNGGFTKGRAAVEERRVAKGVAAVKEAVAAEVRKAKAEALRDAADHIEDVVANARPEQAFTEHVLMEHGGPGYLRELAAEYEEEK